jgi:predicted nucleic acid-binding protein
LKVYVDSSFLVSLYSPDANTGLAARTMAERGSTRLVTPLAEFEVANALQLRVFRGELDGAAVRKSLEKYELNLRQGAFRLVALPESLFAKAREIALRATANLGTRAIDVLHVAAAVEIGADTFYSFDERQRRLARAQRLKLNPS